MMTGRLPLVTLAMVGWAAAAAAQSGDSASVRPRLDSERRVFMVSNAGVYTRVSGGLGGSPIQAIVDFGAVVNLSPRHGVGASWFIARDENSLYSGPALRWRRWLGPTRSLDIALGTPLTGGRWARPGSALGLVKYNLAPYFGIAVRPELVRYDDEFICDAAGCRPATTSTKARLYLGAELGGKPGGWLGGSTVIVLLAAAALIAASGGIL